MSLILIPSQILAFRFPFIDLLSNHRSAFTYLPSDLISNTPLGIAAAPLYGIDPTVSQFTPSKDAYAYVEGSGGTQRFVKAKPTLKGKGEGFKARFEDEGALSEKEWDL